MTICFICSEYPPALHGGIGSVIQASARMLVRNGHRVKVIGIYPPRVTTPEYEEDQGVEVWRLRTPEGRYRWIGARYHLFQVIREWADRGMIDVVEVPDWEGHASNWPRLRVPVVVRLHGSIAYFGAEMGSRVRRSSFMLESNSYRRADFCSSCSKYTARKTSNIFGEHPQTSVLYNAVSLSTEKQTFDRNPKQVVYAGTLTKKKGIIELVKAWPQVWACQQDAELHVYGKDAGTEDGVPMIPYLRSLLPGALQSTVHFHGHVPMSELRSLYRRCRLAVFPSYAEAFAMAPMEAMAEGCPVIVSNRSSGPELVENGVNGLLVDPDNQPEIAEAILNLLRSDRLAEQIGAAGQKTIQGKFCTDRVADDLISYYSKCVGGFRESRGLN